jgi:hypothetical protein
LKVHGQPLGQRFHRRACLRVAVEKDDGLLGRFAGGWVHALIAEIGHLLRMRRARADPHGERRQHKKAFHEVSPLSGVMFSAGGNWRRPGPAASGRCITGL